MRATRFVLALLLVLGTVGCDQWTKRVASETLEGTPSRSYLGDAFRLEYAENRGAFLGLGAGWPTPVRIGLLVVGTAIAIVGLAIAAIRASWSGWPLIGALLVVGAGSSNLIDRIFRGSVVDFMNMGMGPVRTGIFNVADVILIAGVALILWGHGVTRSSTGQ
jgi:signal peptidase II